MVIIGDLSGGFGGEWKNARSGNAAYGASRDAIRRVRVSSVAFQLRWGGSAKRTGSGGWGTALTSSVCAPHLSMCESGAPSSERKLQSAEKLVPAGASLTT